MTQLRSVLIGLALLSGAAISSAGIVAAQDAEEAPPGRPIHIHEGTCAELNPTPLAPLTDITERMPEEDAEDTDPRGVLTATTVLYSETEVELALDDILAASHAINVHESQENAQNYIACGDIGGIVVADQMLVGIQQLNDSGFSGVAVLESNDDKTTVKVYLVEPAEGPAATPAT